MNEALSRNLRRNFQPLRHPDETRALQAEEMRDRLLSEVEALIAAAEPRVASELRRSQWPARALLETG